MKKIIAFLLIGIFLNSNISFAASTYDECIREGMSPDICAEYFPDTENGEEEDGEQDSTENNGATENNNQTPRTPQSIMGITCDPDLLVNGQCKLNIYDTLGIRQSVRDEGEATSVGLFIQDIVLSATFFIGTVVTIALVVSGIMFIMASSSGKDPANAKKGIIGSLVGLLIVVSSYVIIRLVQYIAKGF